MLVISEKAKKGGSCFLKACNAFNEGRTVELLKCLHQKSFAFMNRNSAIHKMLVLCKECWIVLSKLCSCYDYFPSGFSDKSDNTTAV